VDGWAIAGRFPGGRPLRRRRVMVWMSPTGGCEGPQPSKPPPIIVAVDGWAIAGRFPGGRPLRRRRVMVWMSPTGGCEGPQPSKPPPIILSSYRTITANSSAQNTCSSSIERFLPIVIARSCELSLSAALKIGFVVGRFSHCRRPSIGQAVV
jgi:hypothetical protein